MSIEFTKVSRTLFRKSKKFRSLNDQCRLLYLYLLVCEHINSSGCYQLSEGYAKTDLQWDDDAFAYGMETLCKAGLIAWSRDHQTVLIEGWVAFNEPANARHAIGILNQLAEVDDENLKARRFDEYNQIIIAKRLCNERIIGADLNALLNAFAYPIDTVSPPKNENKTEKEKENNNEKENKTENETRAREVSALAAAPSKGDGFAPSGVNPELIELASRLSARTPDFPEIPSALARRKA